ncbi:LOB domain-containing protein CRL1-like [Phoenix dactylifera]|uniref:LOB domain-containing protein CRL1-like n=1 Tax=Phoenix dactylifera TaxID=42345 RepID=A0A8B7BG24_PHODC|nr:LOB domain-containing protein CRL1-like [Phoenix dactylifera]
MTGFGSPCGACKFLRRKCVRGCVFAPYFCHEQGAAHFAAIHKVFGASNVSKLLTHLPVNDRSEAAISMSYEAQARLQDPIYGCVAHIFALQQQVVNLQAQLASLKAQAAQEGLGNGSRATLTPQEDKLCKKFPPFQQDGQVFFQTGDGRMLPPFHPNTESMNYYNNELLGANCIQSSQLYNPRSGSNDEDASFCTEDDPSCAMATLDMQPNTWTSAYHDMEDLQSVTFAYLHGL